MDDLLNAAPQFGKAPRSASTSEAAISALAQLDKVMGQVPTPPAPAAPQERPASAEPAITHPSNKTFQHTREDLRAHRAMVESRLKDIQFGDVLRSGRLTQEVIIHSKALVVEFQDLLYTERQFMNQIMDSKKDLGPRETQVYLVVYPLALGIKTINGIPLPAMEKNTAAFLEERVNFVTSRLSGTWLELTWHNYNWFLERCQAVTTEELGNG